MTGTTELFKKKEIPGDGWTRHDVRILIKTDDYLKACQRYKQSLHCTTSDLQSDAGEDMQSLIKRKRKRITKTPFGDNDSDDDDHDGITNSARNLKSKQMSSLLPAAPALSALPVFVDSSAPTSVDVDVTSHNCLYSPPSITMPSPVKQGLRVGQQSSRPHLFTPSYSLGIGQYGNESIPCTAAELHIMTMMENVRQHQIQQAVTLNNVLSLLQSGSSTVDPSPELPEEFIFPLKDINDLDHFEAWLKNPENKVSKQKMISFLATIGGSDCRNTVWNILNHVIHNDLAKKINWKGVNEKRPFKNLIVKSVILPACRIWANTYGPTSVLCKKTPGQYRHPNLGQFGSRNWASVGPK
ncbi:hypothetical protein HHUSO_G14766 [Huso huso]|uniref:DUF4806 domain-containing protein n=1 Tax=Huso huso TaxID=61971 RepID=A0ABR0ZEZ9_HUSHU